LLDDIVLDIKDLSLKGVSQPHEALMEIFMNHLGLLPLKEVPPGKDLDLSIPDDKLLDKSHLIVA
jgi:hypothetical protein